MSSMSFLKLEIAGALGRGVLQCVTIGSRPLTLQAYNTSTGQVLKMFTVDEEQSSDSDTTFVPTQFMPETLVTSLGKTTFNIREPSLFVWLGGTVYRTVESVLASLAFIASLPKGSGVILDYAAKRTSLEPLSRTALDGLACRISMADGTATYFIQPEAVTAMLRGLSFRRIVNSEQGESPQSGLHLVSAVT